MLWWMACHTFGRRTVWFQWGYRPTSTAIKSNNHIHTYIFRVFERAQDYTELRRHYFFHVMKLLIDIHSKSNAPMKVLELSSLLVDPRYNIHKVQGLVQIYCLARNLGIKRWLVTPTDSVDLKVWSRSVMNYSFSSSANHANK